MPSRIETLLENRHNDLIDYDFIGVKYPWILERNLYCVISPDSDGFLCALAMSKYLNWKIVGFYDDKVSVINKDYLDKKVVFLDGEIFRENARSVGHHMLTLNKRHIPESFKNFDNCLQPNLIRNYDCKSDFRLKYPLATIHLLVSILGYFDKNINLPDSALTPLFFTDGLFNVLFKYPENVLNWIKYLRINEEWNPLYKFFCSTSHSVFDIMNKMNDFFRQRDDISIHNERGDRLRLSHQSDGSPRNIEDHFGACMISQSAYDRILRFINMIAGLTTWQYQKDSWLCWSNLQFYEFTKRDIKNSDRTSLTLTSFSNMLNQNPLSWAITSSDNIEYTLEIPGKFAFLV